MKQNTFFKKLNDIRKEAMARPNDIGVERIAYPSKEVPGGYEEKTEVKLGKLGKISIPGKIKYVRPKEKKAPVKKPWKQRKTPSNGIGVGI